MPGLRNGRGNGLHGRKLREVHPQKAMNFLPEARVLLGHYPGDAFVAEALAFIQPKPWREVAVSPQLEREME